MKLTGECSCCEQKYQQIEEMQSLLEENTALKAQIKELQQYIKNQSVVNGYLRRSNERKSKMRRWFL